MSATITPSISLTAVETIALAASPEASIQQSGFNCSGPKFSATTTPPVTHASYQSLALAGGTRDIDLTALPNAVNVPQDCTGKKVQTILIKNPAGNDAITISPGGANPYPLFGTGNSVVVPGHATIDTFLAMVVPEGLPDVAAGAKIITVTGTGTQSFHIGLTLG